MTGAGRAPVVYLHVGEPKCGTTFVQRVLWDNRTALARHGVLLPGLSAQDHFRANQDLREVPQPADDPAGSYAGEWDLLARQAVRADRAAVISHELLAGATQQQADRAVASLRGAQVHVVLTLRDFVSLLPAEWQETVKHGSTLGWPAWLRRVRSGEAPDAQAHSRWFWRVHDTVEVLQRWGHSLPPEHVHVVTVPPPGSPPGLLWERFATAIGVDPGVATVPAARPNASLGLAETEMLRRLNQALGRGTLPPWYYATQVKDQLAHQVLAARPAAQRPQLSAEQAEWAHERAARVAAALKDAGYDIVGALDDLVPPPGEPSDAGPGGQDVPAEALLDAALDTLAAMLRTGYERGTGVGKDGGLAGSPRLRRTLRDLSGRYPALGRLVRRMGERARAARHAP